MLDLLTAPEGVVFTAALALMVAIGLVEAMGLGASGLGADADIDHGGLLDWLGAGRVPFLVLLVSFLAAFGAIGLAGQQISQVLTGGFLRPLIAIPATLAASLPVTALLARVLARVMPRDETTAIGLDELIGLTGKIALGRAEPGSPARARVMDRHGQAHHVLAEPDNEGSVLDEGDVILLVRREGNIFRAILHERPRYSDWSIT